jgi:hypothetical protein
MTPTCDESKPPPQHVCFACEGPPPTLVLEVPVVCCVLFVVCCVLCVVFCVLCVVFCVLCVVYYMHALCVVEGVGCQVW